MSSLNCYNALLSHICTIIALIGERKNLFSLSQVYTDYRKIQPTVSIFKPVACVQICSVCKPVPPAISAQLEAPLPGQRAAERAPPSFQPYICCSPVMTASDTGSV